jgi:hypothetical protein
LQVTVLEASQSRTPITEALLLCNRLAGLELGVCESVDSSGLTAQWPNGLIKKKKIRKMVKNKILMRKTIQ